MSLVVLGVFCRLINYTFITINLRCVLTAQCFVLDSHVFRLTLWLWTVWVPTFDRCKQTPLQQWFRRLFHLAWTIATHCCNTSAMDSCREYVWSRALERSTMRCPYRASYTDCRCDSA